MRALTLRQPWASLVALGVKTIETRGWSTAYRGPLLIHAGKAPVGLPVLDPLFTACEEANLDPRAVLDWNGDRWVERALDSPRTWGRPMPLGAVVAVCNLADVVPIDGMNMGGLLNFVCPHDRGGLTLYRFGNGGHRPATTSDDITDQEPYGDFSEPGRYAWLLTDVRPLTTPVHAKGRLGLWTPEPDLVAAVEAAR